VTSPVDYDEFASTPPVSPPAARAASRLQAGLSEVMRSLGPGLITRASDDDPSGISTYSMAGARFGYSFLWTALFTFPLVTAVQLMCARLGTVKGKGLAAVARDRYPRWVLLGTCGLLLFANLVNASKHDAPEIETLMALIGQRQSELWQEAKFLGARIYAGRRSS
jgi:hypothetical protein